MLVPGAMTIALAFQSGGYGASATAVGAVEMTVLLAVWLILADQPLGALPRPLAIAVAALVALAIWAAVSAEWSVSGERAPAEAVRVVLYAATVALFGLSAGTPGRGRVLVLGLAGACVTISTAALVSRTLPGWVGGSSSSSPDRLAYPISYWNGLGILAALGIVLCLYLTSRSNESLWVELFGAAALPLLVGTLYATQSRGASLAAIGAVGLYVFLARPVGLLAVAVAVVPPTVAAVVAAQLTMSDSGTRSTAGWLAVALAACACSAAVLRSVVRTTPGGAVHHLLRGGTSASTLRRSAIAGLAVFVVAALVWVGAGSDHHASSDRKPRAGSTRLLNAGSSARFKYWEVALHAARDSPFIGKGAGSFELEWVRYRHTPRLFVRKAHSLYLGTLAELGLTGLAFLLIAFSALMVALVRRVRDEGQDRALWAAVFAASVAWFAHAAVDWDWELPAVSLWLFASGGAALAQRPNTQRRRSHRYVYSRLLSWALAAICVGTAVYGGRLAIAAARVNAAVAAARAGDCTTAEARAHESLRWRDQSEPYVVIAWCRRISQPGVARNAMSQAVERDPNDWRLRYDFALLLALGGRDGRSEAEKAATLNPLDAGVIAAARALGDGTPETRRAFARSTPFVFR
jgi:hypothetical protein